MSRGWNIRALKGHNTDNVNESNAMLLHRRERIDAALKQENARLRAECYALNIDPMPIAKEVADKYSWRCVNIS